MTNIKFFSDNGGIYLDTDILVLKPFTALMNHSTCVGRNTPMSVGNGLILSRSHAPFLCMWMHNYRTYQPWPWSFSHNGGEMAHVLAKVSKCNKLGNTNILTCKPSQFFPNSWLSLSTPQSIIIWAQWFVTQFIKLWHYVTHSFCYRHY